ncbi:hypothetical protein C8A03DRAFT_37569 [Achaetomium macrosporum]|uniref:Deacetylase sirtuin-type domain-containing protein n=1 Tax=Achaetomium macrosporum TaxID=79813 RepID=A0AAN7C3H6_9PEZI|nr:hypothetical protein C8A03DRAFT_37569 [Achaetomium macrosporum]
MPTTHVEPGCDPLLQDIANTLWKARKVVVITGAGISTNSGIPDFRSENGLYSLIQAQFDAAQHQAANGNSDVGSDASFDDRPTKRRRVSRDDSGVDGRVTPAVERPFPGLCKGAANDSKAAQGEPANRIDKEEAHPSGKPSPVSTLPQLRPETSDPRRNAGTAKQESVPSVSDSTPIRSVTPIQSPRISPRQMDAEEAHPQRPAMEPPPPFPSSPPNVTLGTPRPQPRPQLLHSFPRSSSPLSSPPPVAFDPYQESTCPPSSQESESSRSESEEPSTALSSQTSVGSSRSSLPIMKGRDLFDAQIWSCPIKTSVFYTFVSTLRQKVRTAEPTSSHRFLSVLRDSRKLVRCYTQNIDQLEERVGLSTSLSLGAGSRYRFSARAGRVSGGLKSSAKAAEGASGNTEGPSQKGGARQAQPQPRVSQQHGHDPDLTDPREGPPQTTQLPQSASDLSSTSNDASMSTSAAPTPPSAPAAPNRGVECVFLHGSLAELRCFVCARTAPWDDETRLADTLAGRQPTCPHCAGATAAREERGKRALGVGKLRPDIVLYGEEHPHAHLISPLVQHDLSLGPDMLLILGTSMRVHGLKVLVREFAKAVHDRGGKVVFVNFTKPPESVWADIIDYWVQWDCDAWVGDLQQRKPALWLPPGAAPPDEDKVKVMKLSRKQSSAESKNRKKGTENTSKKGRESDALGCKQEKDGNTSSFAHGQTSNELNPPQQMSSQEMPSPALCQFPDSVAEGRVRVARAAREPKLNPAAKRPASVRDHKLNGAYLVWKIMQDLGRITNRPLNPTIMPSPMTNRSLDPATMSFPPTRRKRLRKSSPAASDKAQRATTTTSPLSPHPNPQGPSSGDDRSSISAAVKSRKRKCAVVWRMVNGVETLVPLGDATGKAIETPIPKPRQLPPPTRTAPQPSASTDVDAGFRNTDRLIAAIRQPLSRPTTPARLAPLKTLPEQHGRTPKLTPLEPKITSPGPRAEISSNVGSPVTARQPSPSKDHNNPFFFADPLAGWLVSAPVWFSHHGHAASAQCHGQGQHGVFLRHHHRHDRQEQSRGYAGQQAGGVSEGRVQEHQHLHQQSQQRQKGERPHEGISELHHQSYMQTRLAPEQAEPRNRGSGLASGSSSWSPDEQLRKEHEAALMLSSMKGRGATAGECHQ